MATLGDQAGASIRDVDKELASKMSWLSYDMFCIQKQKKKSFTVCHDIRLRKMKITEDADGLADEDNLYLEDFLNIGSLSLEAFSELAAISYLKPSKKSLTDTERLLYASVFSRYSDEEYPVFFFVRDRVAYIFHDKTTSIRLTDYLKDYFTTSDISEIEMLTHELSVPGSSFFRMQKTASITFQRINENTRHKYDFINGAITFLDFLGWKGRWQSQDGNSPENTLSAVSSMIRAFRDKLNVLSQELYTQAEGIQLSRLISISDTIAIFTPKVSTVNECKLLELHAKLSRFILEQCAKNKFPIRGTITYGEYGLLDNIMQGPGIDECASWYETGDWIGVHFTPTAQIYWNTSATINTDVICNNYNVPLKSSLKGVYCVKWEITESVYNELALNTKALLPEIARKYMNTYDFLRNTIWKGADSNGKNE